jgi:hypothetical protein
VRLAANLLNGLLLSLSATTAPAQEIRVPPIESGGQVTAFGALGEGLYMRPLVGPRVTVNMSQRNYVYFEGDSASDMEGVLKIDSIALITE